jgi:hypothetical protein
LRRAVLVDPVLADPPPFPLEFLGFDRLIIERGIGLGTQGGGIRVAVDVTIQVSRHLIRQDELIVDFRPDYGLWVWQNNTTWVHLHGISPLECARE